MLSSEVYSAGLSLEKGQLALHCSSRNVKFEDDPAAQKLGIEVSAMIIGTLADEKDVGTFPNDVPDIAQSCFEDSLFGGAPRLLRQAHIVIPNTDVGLIIAVMTSKLD